jgi:hypothetical protein
LSPFEFGELTRLQPTVALRCVCVCVGGGCLLHDVVMQWESLYHKNAFSCDSRLGSGGAWCWLWCWLCVGVWCVVCAAITQRFIYCVTDFRESNPGPDMDQHNVMSPTFHREYPIPVDAWSWLCKVIDIAIVSLKGFSIGLSTRLYLDSLLDSL